jgi:hypothetical protein
VAVADQTEANAPAHLLQFLGGAATR